MRTAKHWQASADGKIECTLCPRHCRIANGDHGTCRVRQHIDGKLIAASYGLISGLAVDPIEKKPLRHFLPGTQTLSFGTVGCNLLCKFCQNDSLSHARSLSGRPVSPEEIVATALEHECKSVAFTYNEPTVFFEFAIDTAIACHEAGLKTVAVTNGWIETNPRREFFAHMDAANVDLKTFTNRFYEELCGATRQPVLDTLTYLKNETDVHLEVTTLLIPNQNDSNEEIDAMTQWAAATIGTDVPWHFSAYHPMPNWHRAPPTPAATLYRAKAIAEKNGLQTIYLGNIPSDQSHEFTHDRE